MTSRKIAEERDGLDLVSNPKDWNALIPENNEVWRWSAGDVATFQLLIDTRTLELYERLLVTISPVLPEHETVPQGK